MATGEDIKKLRKEKRWIQQELADRVGVAKNTILDWEKGRYFPEGENLKNLAKALEISVAYLLGETNDPIPPQKTKEGTPSPPDLSKIGVDVGKRMALVPVVSGVKACCGNGNIYPKSIEWEVSNTIPMPIAKKDLDGYSWQSKDFKIIEVEGDSMAPRINDGDHVLFVCGVEVDDGQFAVVLHEGRLFIRAIDRQEGRLFLRPVNDGYMTREVREGDHFFIVGLVLYIVPKPKPAGRLW